MSTATKDPFVTPARAAPGRPARVLYAEDLRELRELMRHILHRAGYEIETVVDGGEALRRLREDLADFDLLITDHHMPGVNGLELVRQLPTTPYRGKVMVFSSEIDPAVHHEYHQLGVQVILPKPIRPDSLRQILVQMLSPAP